jgi:hypothetical protein
MLSVFGFGRRRRWRVRRSSLGVSEHAVLRHSAPGWQQQVEAGSCSAEATWRPGSGLDRNEVNRLVPPVRDGMDGLFGRNPVVASGISMYRGGYVDDLRVGDGSATPPRRWSQRGIGVTNHIDWSCFGTVQKSGGRQRQEGNGRSDAVRLSASGMLRRV